MSCGWRGKNYLLRVGKRLIYLCINVSHMKPPLKFKSTLLVALIAAGSASISSAATMIAGSGIIVTVNSINSTGNFPPQSVVDGTGLSTTTGVHGSGGNSEWYTSNGITPAESWISFDLGATVVLDSIHVWNAVQYTGFGIDQLDIYVSTLASPGDPEGAGAGDWTQIGTDVNFAVGSATSTGFDLETQTGISLPTTAVRHVAFYSDTQHGGGNNYLGLAEVQFFEADAVPEPSAVLLGGLGVLALLRRRRH